MNDSTAPKVAPPVKADYAETLQALRENMSLRLKGKPKVIDQALTCLLAGGHLLIEDLPGVGKTTLAYCLAKSINGSFSRIQFTSDLLPTDVTGVSVYDEKTRSFHFRKGPIFANIVLADEINRTTPKTQSSLLEVMDRAKVTADGETYPVGSPFLVFATQNPVDYEGTFPLPESQMDRFLMRVSMGYPSPEDEMEVLQLPKANYDEMNLEPVVEVSVIQEMQDYCAEVFLEDSILQYLVRLANATRTENLFKSGISPRGTLALKAVAQARAMLARRKFVIPADIREGFVPVLQHRLHLRQQTGDPFEEKRIIASVLEEILEKIPDPT
ncbi:MAG: MoxR family ATPase [Opitutales bacterium]|nr:MoxR family ATPase [Opitutales bacterium]MCH8541293.1 MoxR family ATPase [Opitutales bacterium]